MSEALLVRGRWIVTGAGADDPVLSDGALVVTDGVIAELGAWDALRARFPEAEVIGSGREALLPGLINAHHHTTGATYLQQGFPDLLLEPWIWTLSAGSAGDLRLASMLSAARQLRSGVTTVLDVHSGSGAAEVFAAKLREKLAGYETAGPRLVLAAGCSDQSRLVHGRGADEAFVAGLPAELRPLAEGLLPPPGTLDGDDYLGILEELIGAYRDHPRIDVWFGPPGPQWVSDPVWRRIAEAAERLDVGIQTHVEESIYEKLHGPRDYGKPTVFHLHELGLLSPRFSLAHGVWLSEPEIALLAETGAAVVHNPSSNLRLRAGIAPVNALLAAGVTTALGMDATTINDDEDMFAEMRLASRLQRTPSLDGPAPTPAQILGLATEGGAKLLRQEGRLGRLATGAAADIVLIDLDRVTWPWVSPRTDPRDLVLLRAQARDVTTVLVGGEVVLRDGRPTRFDLAEAGAELAERLDAAHFSPEIAAAVERLLPHLYAHYRDWEVPALEPYVAYNSKR